MKYFNTEGSCRPEEHYMVSLNDRLEQIKKLLVDRKKYFVINRGRQYGKTTTLDALAKYLKDDYIVLSLDFQLMGTEDFVDESAFSHSFIEDISAALQDEKAENKEDLLTPLLKLTSCDSDYGLKELFVGLSSMCENSPRPIVLMIDEVDSASNNQVFKELRDMIEGIIYQGKIVPFSPDEKSVSIGAMFGFLVEKDGHVAIANRIFEMYLLNLFMAEEAIRSDVFSRGESDAWR